MASEDFEIVLRIFYQTGSSAAVYIEDGKIKGILYKRDIVGRLSDIEISGEISDQPLYREVRHINLILQELENRGALKKGEKNLTGH